MYELCVNSHKKCTNFVFGGDKKGLSEITGDPPDKCGEQDDYNKGGGGDCAVKSRVASTAEFDDKVKHSDWK